MPDFKVRQLGKYGQMTVYLVNGEAIRDSSLANEEFGTNAIHCDFPALIPAGELWIEDDVPQKEIQFLVVNGLARYRLMLGGMPQEKAYDRALELETRTRSSGTGTKNISKQLLYTYGQYNVYLVKGFAVRDKYKTDFIEGGNHSAYEWIPQGEIWIEAALHENEYPFILGHEASEDYIITTFKLTYDQAHKIASLIEYKMREHGQVSLEDAIPLAFHVMRKMQIRGR